MERDPGKAKQETTKTADHMSTESDKSPNGVCSLVFFFSRFLHGLLQMARTSKKKQKKQNCKDHMSTESDKSPNGVCSFVFFVILFFRGFCMVCFAVYCCYHIKLPFTLRNPCRTLQKSSKPCKIKTFTSPPPHPPLSLYIYIYVCVLYMFCFHFGSEF